MKAEITSELVNVDGPQVVLLSGSANRRLIGVAVDFDDMEYPFFCCTVHQKDWTDYIANKVDLRFLFEKAKGRQYYLFDWNAASDHQVKLKKASSEEASNQDFWPDHGFFAAYHTVNTALSKVQNETDQAFYIDGKWEPNEFSSLYSKLADVYALSFVQNQLSSTTTSKSTRSAIESAVSDRLFKGGGSYTGFYGDLARKVSGESQLTVDKIQYASPGVIDIRGNREIFTEMKTVIAQFEENFSACRKIYAQIDTALTKLRLKRQKPGASFPSSSIEQDMIRKATSLLSLIGFENSKDLYAACRRDSLIYTKLSLSVFRRVSGIHKFRAQGRLKIEL